ncbi:MAG: ABC transporter ATP-binding protein [Deltaproteobacteria bacterium RBG_16_48_10]|nr:MAG: ABC transporter ATP-binding protein [Deltaproteobacteria bacterium RBG_16_48_10]
MLRVNGIEVFYGNLQALRSVSLEVNEKEIISIVGSNGAGKSTTLMTLSGIIRPRGGEIYFKEKPIHHASSSKIVELGIVQIPEGRQLFPTLNVIENLELGAQFSRAKKVREETMGWVFELFPKLSERKGQLAGTLSGGEQQMLAIGRGLMSRPTLLMLDEPSMGLSPILVKTIFNIIRKINQQGTTILLVEQNIFHSLNLSHRGYVLENGSIVLSGSSQDLLKNPYMRQSYLGL